MLRAAIDEVALAARADRAGHTDPGELASRLAGLWAMIAELDPALAARLHGYGPDTGRDAPLCRHPARVPSLPFVIMPTPAAWPPQHNRKLSNRRNRQSRGPGASAPGQTLRATAKAAGGR